MASARKGGAPRQAWPALDDALAYKTNAKVVIRDAKLGALSLVITSGIFAYIVGYQVLTQKNYLKCYPVQEALNFELSGGLNNAMPDGLCRRVGTPRVEPNAETAFVTQITGQTTTLTNGHDRFCLPRDQQPHVIKPRVKPECAEGIVWQEATGVDLGCAGYTEPPTVKSTDVVPGQPRRHFQCNVYVDPASLGRTLGPGVASVHLSRVHTLSTGDVVAEAVANANYITLDLRGSVFSTPYINDMSKSTMGGFLREIPFKLVNVDGDVVNKCYKYGRRGYDARDACKPDVLVNDQPCEFQSGDEVLIPLEALVNATGWRLDMTLAEATKAGKEGTRQMMDHCMRDLRDMGKGSHITAENFNRLRDVGYVKLMVDRLAAESNLDPPTNIRHHANLEAFFQKICDGGKPISGFFGLLLQFQVSNMGGPKFRNAFLGQMAPDEPTVTMLPRLTVSTFKNGVIDPIVRPGDPDYPTLHEGVQANVSAVKRNGITARSITSGELCEPDFAVLLVTLTSALGLIAAGTSIVEFIMLNVLPRRQFYKVEQNFVTANYGAIMKKVRDNGVLDEMNQKLLDTAAHLAMDGSTPLSLAVNAMTRHLPSSQELVRRDADAVRLKVAPTPPTGWMGTPVKGAPTSPRKPSTPAEHMPHVQVPRPRLPASPVHGVGAGRWPSP